ncbi:hypothetical protein SAMN05216517_102241 [Janthinobacterium sp. OK676]|uniref:DUF6916 family protein n=1 Tax=unclassified Janthinobacterium TaxID=2610881 RepID=UPI0008819524|nr:MULTISPECIES: hypothetical protein [unclassified Janthinobacterium]PJJ19007.1 hypothetical protein CLU90_2218 [Janthinobacterium sp. 67]SDL85145.1 hypothetical protein SAMN05216517_102241 [Janthinobacterium sp. OK676]
MMNVLTLEHFATRVNDTFVSVSDGHAAFILKEVRPLQSATLEGMLRAPFSLLFHHSSAIVFSQKIFQLQHDAFGEVGIFLVPVARDSHGFLYQAVFN